MLGLHVGLILNFGRPTLKEGIDRVFLDVCGGMIADCLARSAS